MVSHKKTEREFLQYKGSEFFRMRLALSLLSHKNIRISQINNGGSVPGLAKYQEALLNMLTKLTNGSTIDIAPSGTRVTFSPGVLLGGEHEFDLPPDRGIGYYLEFLLYLAPFCKHPMEITFKGVTNCRTDCSADYIKHAFLPLIKRYITKDDFTLDICKRGLQPKGGGEVFFKFPIVKQLRPCNLIEMGKVCKIRGVAFRVKCNASHNKKMIHSARSLLNKIIPDVYITDDATSVKGLCPGYGMCLYAETTEGHVIAAETMTKPEGTGLSRSAEEIGKEAALRLLDECYLGGNHKTQPLLCLMMAMNGNNVVKATVGSLHPFTQNVLRLIRDFFGIKFDLKQIEGEKRSKVLLSCRGTACRNIAKKLG